MNTSPVRIFIGSGEASRLERKTLIHSLRKHTDRELDLYVLNGTHNAIEHNDEEPYPAPLSLDLKYKNYTEFSLYRYLIPEICGHQGKAIFMDSDMVCLGDVGELWDTSVEGFDFLATPAYDEKEWGMSVLLIDCSRCRFDLEQVYQDIDAGLYSYIEFARMNPKFLAVHPYEIGPLDPNWNVFDRYDADTKLIHYTELLTQPWKFPGHRYGDVWFEYYNEAIASGQINHEDIHLSIQRSYVRQDIRDGNNPSKIRKVLRSVKRKLKGTAR